jgi:hypothetical protein
MRSNDPEQAPQAVQRLNDRGDHRGVSAVTRKNLPDGDFEAADVLLGFLAFLIGHGGSPSARSGRSARPRPPSDREAPTISDLRQNIPGSRSPLENTRPPALRIQDARSRDRQIRERLICMVSHVYARTTYHAVSPGAGGAAGLFLPCGV